DTERSRTKSLIADLRPRFPDIRQCVLHALENHQESDSWKATPRMYFGVHESETHAPDEKTE
ncbi:MAG: tRNA 2-thiocytidine biosynthesis protein TtcA, partial [Pyramidobacter sp.]|nr:tRNA 2-thiocytidine biosynthesis protein TtcA [Pyramidobacter sp.]